MNQTIRLLDIFGTDLFSRAKATELNAIIDPNADEVTIDFQGINFMSRSFTDELLNIFEANQGKSFHFLKCNEDIIMMLSIVSNGREHERNLGITHPKMYKFENSIKLGDFLIDQ